MNFKLNMSMWPAPTGLLYLDFQDCLQKTEISFAQIYFADRHYEGIGYVLLSNRLTKRNFTWILYMKLWAQYRIHYNFILVHLHSHSNLHPIAKLLTKVIRREDFDICFFLMYSSILIFLRNSWHLMTYNITLLKFQNSPSSLYPLGTHHDMNCKRISSTIRGTEFIFYISIVETSFPISEE